jgi:hypothetical protein
MGYNARNDEIRDNVNADAARVGSGGWQQVCR